MIAAEPPRRRFPSWLPQVLSYSLSAVCLVWALHGYDLKLLATEFGRLDWKWVALAVLVDLAVYVCHGWRWQTLLAPVSRLGFWRTVQSVYIGLFANEVFPLRPGEVIRCYLLTHWNDLRLSVGLASAALERVIDGMWLLIFFGIAAARKGMPTEVAFMAELTGGLVVVAIGLFLWILHHHRQGHAMLTESRWSATLRHIMEGLQLMGNPRTLLLTVGISLLYFALQVVTMWALMRASAFDYSILEAGGVVTIVRLGTLLPNAPGNVGLVNAAVMVALRLFEGSQSDAKGFSFVYLVAQTLPLLIGGAIATALTGLNIGQLREHARARAAQR